MPPLTQAHLQSIYRPIIIVFCSMAVLILGIALFSGSAGAVITLSTIPKEIKTTVTVTIGPKTDGGVLYLTGNVTSEKLAESVIVKPSGTGSLVPAHARGRVTFHNETAKDQPLAVGTRLRPEAGDIIVRTTARVDVPAGGTVDADVVADPLGESGNVSPGRFIIVALWPGLQDQIYATSEKTFTGGLASQAGGLSLDELTKASNQAEQAIRDKFGTSFPGTLKQIIPSEVEVVPPADEPSSEYTVTVNTTGLTVTYDANQLSDIARDHLERLVPDDQTLNTLAEPKLVVENQPTTDEIVVTIQATGTNQITSSSRLLDPEKFVGLGHQEIVSLLTGNDVVRDVTVAISPPWRQTAPKQEERIRIVIRNSE